MGSFCNDSLVRIKQKGGAHNPDTFKTQMDLNSLCLSRFCYHCFVKCIFVKSTSNGIISINFIEMTALVSGKPDPPKF